MIGSRRIDGFEGLLLASEAEGGIEAAFVPSAGMVCASLLHRGEQLLGLREGLRGYTDQRATMGIPLLYPWANRLGAPRFRLLGREVDLSRCAPPPKLDDNGLPMHGLLTAAPGWEVERHEQDGDAAVLAAAFEFGGGLADGFPFPHTVLLEARLAAATLVIRVTVHADRGAPVPIAFGLHPYLQLPGIPRAEWRLEAPLTERISLDELGLPTGQRHRSEPFDGPIGRRTYDDAFAAPDPGETLALSGAGRRIEVGFDAGFPVAQLYAPPAGGLFAYEPMTAPANALITGDGLRAIEPGERFSAALRITLANA